MQVLQVSCTGHFRKIFVQVLTVYITSISKMICRLFRIGQWVSDSSLLLIGREQERMK